MNLYDKDGRLIGRSTDNVPVIFSQTTAPEDDELDDLLLESAKAILTRPELKKRIVNLTPNENGVNSPWLMEELTLWATQGNLRDVQQINFAVSEYIDYAERLAALGVFNDWKIDRWILRRLRWFFLVPESQPLQTKKEILAERERLAHEDQQRREQAAKDKRQQERELAEYQKRFAASPEGQRAKVVEDAVTLIVGKPVEFADPHQPTSDEIAASVVNTEDRNRIMPYLEAIAKARPLVTGEDIAVRWLRADALYVEMWQLVEGTPHEDKFVKQEDFIMNQVVADLGPAELTPLKEGEFREFFSSPKSWLKDMGDNLAKWDAIVSRQTYAIQKLSDGRLAVTFMPRKADQ
jgi:hypothetical protein